MDQFFLTKFGQHCKVSYSSLKMVGKFYSVVGIANFLLVLMMLERNGV